MKSGSRSSMAKPARCVSVSLRDEWSRSARQLAKKFLLVQVVLKCLAAVDEDDRNLVVIEPADFRIGVDVDLLPCEAAAFLQLGKGLLHDLAQMASLARIKDHLARSRHAGSVAVCARR